MASATNSTANTEKEAEAWGTPPAYNANPPLPPIASHNAPPPAAYTAPSYNAAPAYGAGTTPVYNSPTAPATIHPQQQQPPPQQQQPQQQLQHAQQQQQQTIVDLPNQGQGRQPNSSDTNSPGSRKGWADQSARVCAGIQIACGGLMFIFQIVAIVIDSNLHEIGTGIWGGLFMIITGIIGVVAANKKSTGSIVAYMVLSILVAVLCIPLVTITAIGLGQDMQGDYDYYWGFFFKHDKVSDKSRAAMNGMMMMIVILEAIVAITASILCCRAACCGSNSHNPSPNQVNVVYVGHVPYGGGQYPAQYQQVMFLHPQQYHMTTQMAHYPRPGGAVTVTHGHVGGHMMTHQTMHTVNT